MLTGGVPVSVILDAKTVTVHVSAVAKLLAGSSEYVGGPPETVAECAPESPQPMANHGSVAITAWLNVIVMFASRATSPAPAPGEVDATPGAVQRLRGEALLRGFGGPAAKSALFASLSVHPFVPRTAAVVFDSVGAAPPSSKQVAVVP